MSSVVPLRIESPMVTESQSETFPASLAGDSWLTACRGKASCLVFLVLSQFNNQSQRQERGKEGEQESS